MIKHFVRHTFTLILLAAVVAGFNSCKDDISLIADDGSIPDMTGEQVTFNTALSSAVESLSRSYIYDNNYQGSYKPVIDAYKLKITMWQKNDDDSETQLRTCTYVPDGTEGFLKASPAAGESALYWDSSTTPYAFSVAAGTDTPEADQSDKAKWLAQDALVGYGFEPLVGENPMTGLPLDDLNEKNYHTAKEWYKYNQIWMSAEQGMVPKTDLKRIPLFLSHTRSWITVILKAGEGVDRSVLDYDNGNAASRISTEIFSYTADPETSVKPWLQECDVVYEKDVNGEAETRRGVRYDAIVTPKSYLETDKRICKINVSSQNFSFYPSNDPKYETYMHDGMSNSDVWAYMDEAYNPKAGVHVTYTVTLSRESRKILITAYVEDWTELVTQSICDDFGMNGDPITIQNRQQLIDFLSDDTKNKPGNVAIVSAAAIDLDKKKDGESLTDDPWSNYNRYDLKCTLNLGGSMLSTSSQFVKDIAASGSIINGSIHMKSGSSVATAVCGTNEGSIEYLSVTADAGAKASVAGIAQTNYGTITKCRSNLPVQGDGTTEYVGGIAAQSIFLADQTTIPVIDNCEVTARVGIPGGTSSCYGGGIVGQAAGRVSNCTYEYGVSLLESLRKDVSSHPLLLSIINQAQDGQDLTAYSNQWPTADTNTIGNHASANANLRTSGLYDAVIDCQDELEKLVEPNSTYNASGKNYRIADSFTVSSDAGWPLKSSTFTTDKSTHGNVLFLLEGNGKTITLTGNAEIGQYGATSSSTATVYSAPMLFNNIMGTVQNLNIYCEKSLYGKPVFNQETGKNTYTDGCGTLAYAVFGGTVRNVTVYGASGAFVQASTAGGIVVSLHNGSTIENCDCFMPVIMYLPYEKGADVSDAAKYYSGGIAACSENGTVTVTQCRYINTVSKSYTGTKKPNCFLGGIVGGLRRTESGAETGISTDNPSLTISDCASWFEVKNTQSGSTGGQTSGSLIGRARFSKQEGSNSKDYNGMSNCQGNWWYGNVGAGSWVTANEAAAIGKKNSVEPGKPTAPTN
ncbi:MAG: hypothetical protein ACI4UW_01105 [Muribaculaceae bacterium]